tara:strand:- start:284 stop:1450 length:1167 start_codon:yes stop_codon:yes gene_type:complete
MSKRKICVITGTRAEYGLLRWVIDGVQRSNKLKLQIIATGMHLSPEFGLTFKEIEKDGYKIDKKVEMLISSDSSSGITKSVGIGMIGFSDAIKSLKPDLVLVVGDRFEIFAAVSAAMIARVPVAHCHGGETTQGSIDEPIRHSITKMSQLHFVASQEFKNRVIQLGEQPNRVFLVGGLGVDNINSVKLFSKENLEKSIDFKFGKKNLLVTFHPVTLENSTARKQMNELLSALKELNSTNIVFTMPNADTDGRIIFKLIDDFVKRNSNSKSFISLGQKRYLSMVKYVDVVVGNSSSGLLEVPSFKKATINIGDRQKGRTKAESIIDCKPEKKSILKAIEKAYTKDFQKTLNFVENPYGEGGASKKIVNMIEITSLEGILKKEFYDLENK